MNIKIPPIMQKLPLDARGYPIPYVVLYDDKGCPHFKINDDKKVKECADKNLCTVCGTKMDRTSMWLIGGPGSAFHPRGMFVETPVHRDCGLYSLQTCPYLRHNTYNKKAIHIKDGSFSKPMAFLDPTMSQERLPFFVFVKISGYQIFWRDIGNGMMAKSIKPMKPYKVIEFWQEGVKVVPDKDYLTYLINKYEE